MVKVLFDQHLKEEYRNLFASCVIKPDKISLADAVVKAISANAHATIYRAISDRLNLGKPRIKGIPWFFIGCIHSLECSLNFSEHLHNGDPLTQKTVHVPIGRPVTGNPPFKFEDSAVDALRLRHLDAWKDWTVEGQLWQLEGYNGYGYRQYHPTVLSPYLWSMTNHYSKGKYTADGHFDPDAVSAQLGIAAILKRAQQLGVPIVY